MIQSSSFITIYGIIVMNHFMLCVNLSLEFYKYDRKVCSISSIILSLMGLLLHILLLSNSFNIISCTVYSNLQNDFFQSNLSLYAECFISILLIIDC